jgi:hypothetical protein
LLAGYSYWCKDDVLAAIEGTICSRHSRRKMSCRFTPEEDIGAAQINVR